MKKSRKLSLYRETLRELDNPRTLAEAGGAYSGSAGIECSGKFTACASQYPNCDFTSTCPPETFISCPSAPPV